jgi:hypothetical protein
MRQNPERSQENQLNKVQIVGCFFCGGGYLLMGVAFGGPPAVPGSGLFGLVREFGLVFRNSVLEAPRHAIQYCGDREFQPAQGSLRSSDFFGSVSNVWLPISSRGAVESFPRGATGRELEAVQ